MSTDGSDEDQFRPKVTLSFGIPSLTNGPPRWCITGYKTPGKWPCSKAIVHGESLIYAGEWLYLEPSGQCRYVGGTATSDPAVMSGRVGVPRVARWDPVCTIYSMVQGQY